MKTMFPKVLILMLLTCLFCVCPALAEDVAEVNGTPYATVQEAINAASDGNTITLLTETAEDVAVSGKTLTLDLNGKTLTSTGAAGSTFFSVTNSANVTVKNGTMAGAADADGNAMKVTHAVYVQNAAFTLDAATISGHSVEQSGGGIYADAATIVLQNGAVVTGNNANGATTTSSKSVGNGGGGVFACNGTDVTIDKATVSKNTASISGGGIFLSAAKLVIQNSSEIVENVAQSPRNYNGGGGIYSTNKSTMIVSDSHIDNNIGGSVNGTSKFSFSADGDGIGAVYGNTTTGDASGQDLNLTPNKGTVNVMAASSMRDGETALTDYAFISGFTVYPKDTVLTKEICDANAYTGYTVQPYVERYVAQNVSGEECAVNGEKYMLLAAAISAVESEDEADTAHVIKLIAGENDNFGTEIIENVSVGQAMEIQLNGCSVKPSNGAAITVNDGAKLILSGAGVVDSYNASVAALVVNGECVVNGAAEIPSVRLGSGKSVAVTASAKVGKVYLDAEVLSALNLAAEDMTVVLFTPVDNADISSLLPSVEVQEITSLVSVHTENGNIVASCKKVEGVFIDGVSGKDANSGLSPDKPVKTFAKAAEILADNPDFGGVYVVNTVSVSNTQEWTLPEGKWLKRHSSHAGSMVNVSSGGVLTLKDIVMDGNSEIVTATNAMVKVSSGGTLNIQNGATLRNNVCNDASKNFEYGGAVYAQGNVNMSGGEVSSNVSDNGAGICMSGGAAKLILSGGIIKDNICNKDVPSNYGTSGGGVLLVYGADMDMSGGTVSGNAARYGAGIAVGAAYDSPDSILTMTYGTVDGNAAIQQGGGIFVQTNCKAIVSGGNITNNTAGWTGVFAGGGIYVNGNRTAQAYNYGELYLTDALIFENTAGTDASGTPGGGGIAGCETSNTLIYNTHGAAIYNNTGMDLALKRSVNGLFGTSAPYGDIAEYMLGGGAYNWTDENGIQYTSTKLDNFDTFSTLKANPTAAAIMVAQSRGKVVITGNSTTGNGGGIGSNGTVIIGHEENVAQISVTKLSPSKSPTARILGLSRTTPPARLPTRRSSTRWTTWASTPIR